MEFERVQTSKKWALKYLKKICNVLYKKKKKKKNQ